MLRSKYFWENCTTIILYIYLYICVCVYVCMYVCMHACMYIYLCVYALARPGVGFGAGIWSGSG